MVTVPPLTPVTTPVPASIVARAVLLLLQEPPLVALLSVVVAPGHTVKVPVIAATVAFTVNDVIA